MKQPKYCQRCGRELTYREQTFSKGVKYDIYTGVEIPFEDLYRAWICPMRTAYNGMANVHDLYRVIGDQKFEWEETEDPLYGWEELGK